MASRSLAWITDLMFIWTGYAVIVFTGAKVGGALSSAFIVLGMFVLDFSYFVFFELYWAGQSPGKRIFKLRVISARGDRLRFNDVLIRNVMRPVDLLPYAMVVGGTTAVIDRWHRRLGDLVADTLVVRDAKQEIPQLLASERSRFNSFQVDAAVRNRVLSRVSRAERDLILDLAIRRDQTEPSVRESLFATAATHFRDRFALPNDMDHLSDEQTVLNLALLIQDSKFTG